MTVGITVPSVVAEVEDATVKRVPSTFSNPGSVEFDVFSWIGFDSLFALVPENSSSILLPFAYVVMLMSAVVLEKLSEYVKLVLGAL